MTFAQKWNALFRKPAPNMALRIVVLLLGFAFIALGVALSRSTGMGTSPISAIPNTLSYLTPWTIGQLTFAINILFVVAEIILLRRDFKPIQLLQVVCVVPFSAMIDFFVPFAEAIPQTSYLANVAVLVVAMVSTGLGVFLEVKSCMIPLPGEGVSTAVSQAFKLPFHKCKIGFDTFNITGGAIISLLAAGQLLGVREGSIAMAICVGLVVKLFSKLMPNFEKFCPTEGMYSFGSETN